MQNIVQSICRYRCGLYGTTIWTSITLLHPNCPFRQVPISFKSWRRGEKGESSALTCVNSSPHPHPQKRRRELLGWLQAEMRGLAGFALAFLALLKRPLYPRAECSRGAVSNSSSRSISMSAGLLTGWLTPISSQHPTSTWANTLENFYCCLVKSFIRAWLVLSVSH